MRTVHLGSQLEAEVAEEDGKADIMHHVGQRLANALPTVGLTYQQILGLGCNILHTTTQLLASYAAVHSQLTLKDVLQ